MEMLLLLLLLSTLDKNSDLTGKLRGALAFYRENRDLLQMMMNAAAGGQSFGGTPSRSESESREPEKTSRPSDGRADSLKIFEEYLKRSAV